MVRSKELKLWDCDGTLEHIHHWLYVAAREQGRPRSQPDGGDHRQPERQSGLKRVSLSESNANVVMM